MTLRIPRSEWPNFLDDLTKRRFEWKTNLEVINPEIGDQILSNGLPLMGVTVEQKHEDAVIEIILGKDADHHQTHNIFRPSAVSFLPNPDDSGGILEVEEEDGTKTLIRIMEPMPIETGYGAYWTAHA